MKVLFVLNPSAGTKNHQKIMDELKGYCKRIELEYHIHQLADKKDPKVIRKLIEEKQIDTVVACGGDGTINFLGSIILHSDIKLAIIPLGSANGLATALSIKLNIEKIVDKIVKGEYYHMDVLRINDRFNCFHLSSLGFNARLVKLYEKSRSKGMWGYAKHFLDAIKKTKAHRYKLTFNGKKFYRKAEMITFANARKYGTGAVINPEGKIDDGKFEVCIFKPFPWYVLLHFAFLFFMGNLKDSEFVSITSTREAIIESGSKENLEIDGDIEGKFSKIHVKMMQAAIKVIC